MVEDIKINKVYMTINIMANFLSIIKLLNDKYKKKSNSVAKENPITIKSNILFFNLSILKISNS